MWEGFAAFFVFNFLYAIFIAIRRDIVWTVSSAWLALSVWQETPKSAPVSVSYYRPLLYSFTIIIIRTT